MLFAHDTMYASGALVLALGGNIELITALAQGCRPIGEPMFVSSCEGNKISTLDGRPAGEILNDLFEHASESERTLMQSSLFIGITMHPGETQYEQGDFLIRNIAGADAASGAIWVAAELRENQVVQFHVRDAHTSSADLDHHLTRMTEELGDEAASGALLFSCIGRGRGLYGHANHDSAAVLSHLGQLALGGFFCNGEIGPVSGSSFVHGYTSAIAVFREKRA